MGYQVRDVCYETAIQANTASAAAEIGSIKQVGTAQYVVDVGTVTATSINYVLRNVSSTATINSTETVNPRACGMLEGADGITLGWAVGTVWIAIYAVLFLTRSFRNSESSSYGNS